MNELALAFKNRYNRVVIVDVLENKETVKVIQIKYREHVFRLTENLKDGLTISVEVMHEGRSNTLKTYLEAEVFVADKIGEK
jgi:hypothetical protein